MWQAFAATATIMPFNKILKEDFPLMKVLLKKKDLEVVLYNVLNYALDYLPEKVIYYLMFSCTDIYKRFFFYLIHFILANPAALFA